MRRFVLALCALILGAGFSPALPPSTVDRPVTAVAAVPVGAVRVSSPVVVDVAVGLRAEPVYPRAVAGTGRTVAAAVVVPDGVTVGVAAGRAPPRTSA
ncbi:hypothetical protein Daura_46385 [Dactylosporangium aurantiacum]|uniref:Uncharacterized protein n=1 Tax=Dactylosporangium aurantiacum TaxID=35754 RepID=A0A9Q9IJG6_9ACTN|nr:hypothetical protein [Dactylosporangium aurantiacum]MDG6108155.1 hypothetical protein [Dactylosporangium aurantiacum]UWZ53850.1 hypothetical protein Daura_46385 [Dactylosporangium aurantiacum]